MVWAEAPISGIGHLRAMAGPVDLLDRADGRNAFGRPRLQFPGEANRGGEAVPFR